ncbi:RNA polymerase sigma factor [Nannocystis pusilla]|uniref:RNA polymerase sigma factor n=1 Tax=Nannocystis pusilla TaxID=889268 RepID=UPI003B80E560
MDLGMSPSSFLSAHAEERLLLDGLRHIPLGSQVILELHYWEHLSAAEIGAFLAVPPYTARRRLAEAREQLVEAVRELEGEPAEGDSTVAALDDWAESIRRRILSDLGALPAAIDPSE